MTTQYSPKVVTDNIVVYLDPANIKSFRNKPNVLNLTTWTSGSGSVTGFNVNGTAAENQRLFGTDPWGESALVWEAQSAGTNAGNGGWDGTRFPIDETKMYRFSTWVNRTVPGTLGGRFYLGIYGYNSASVNHGVLRKSTGVRDTNLYFWVSSDTPTTDLPTNVWQLVVAHVWPSGSTTGSLHPDSGRYAIISGSTKIGNITFDCIWGGASGSTTQASHRSYLYYSQDATARQRWIQPRVDVVDGTEPSITDLLANNPFKANDISNNETFGYLVNTPRFDSASNACAFIFDGANDYIVTPTLKTTYSNYTIELWIKMSSVAANQQRIYSSANTGTFTIRWNTSADFDFHYNPLSGSPPSTVTGPTGLTYTANTWYHVVTTNNSTTGTTLYINGIARSTGSVARTLPNAKQYFGVDSTLTSWASCSLGLTKIYGRDLSPTEVLQNFNATRARFGI